MTSRMRSVGAARRIVAGLSAALSIGCAFGATSAAAWPEDRGPAEHHRHHHRPTRPGAVLPPPPAIVSGYLPRNNNVPMYNEPPRRGP